MTKYNQVTPEIAAQLQAIVGAKRFFAGDAVKDDFSHDEMPIYGKYYPEVVCEAESTEEVSAILRVCYDNNIPVTPRGAGTGLVGGCVPLCGGVVLCTTRMNKILSYDMNNLVVHIQPGVLLCDLAADALTRGLMYPPDPGEKTATVGGNVSTNAGGMRAVKYGVTRDYVLAMTVVLPDGRVMPEVPAHGGHGRRHDQRARLCAALRRAPRHRLHFGRDRARLGSQDDGHRVR